MTEAEPIMIGDHDYKRERGFGPKGEPYSTVVVRHRADCRRCLQHIPFKVSFRIRRVYFDQIKAGTKTSEFRSANRYWKGRVNRMDRASDGGRAIQAVFVSGREVHRRFIIGWLEYPSARRVLGREPSAQGLKDLGPGRVIAFELGDVLA